MRHTRKSATVLTLFAFSFGLTGCGQEGKESAQDKVAKKVNKETRNREAYVPQHGVEFRNFNDAQKLYDSPNTIIWCSTTWGNASAPLVTIPVTGKLTSSSTSYLPPTAWVDRGNYSWSEVQQTSVDGMYHVNPPQYRYGFTPGGQYVDFFNMPTLCTTALTKFQRQTTKVSVSIDPTVASAQKKAEAALRSGDKAGAEKLLEQAVGGDS